MSVLESIKEAVGLEEQSPKYECQDCGHTFRTDADVDSLWYSCPECEGEDLEQVEERQS